MRIDDLDKKFGLGCFVFIWVAAALLGLAGSALIVYILFRVAMLLS